MCGMGVLVTSCEVFISSCFPQKACKAGERAEAQGGDTTAIQYMANQRPEPGLSNFRAQTPAHVSPHPLTIRMPSDDGCEH